MQGRIEMRGRSHAARGRPLVVTGDAALLDELLSLAEAGGVEATVAVDALAAEEHWARAPLVVVGADQVGPLARRDLPRRLGVVLVTLGSSAGAGSGAALQNDTTATWSGAEALHAEHVVVLPDARSWLVTRFAECRPRALRHAAPVVAFLAGSPGAAASTLAAGVALTARRQGLAALFVGADPFGGGTVAAAAGAGGRATTSPGVGTLAVLSFDRGDGAAVPAEAMAAALRAARHGRDLVVVDLPHVYDDASRLALTCADRCYFVVTAEIRACASAARIAAVARRHCPGLALVVHAAHRRGLRPDEVAEALGLPLVGVLPPDTSVSGSAAAGDAGRVVGALCRRLLAQIGASRRPGNHPAPPGERVGASEAEDR